MQACVPHGTLVVSTEQTAAMLRFEGRPADEGAARCGSRSLAFAPALTSAVTWSAYDAAVTDSERLAYHDAVPARRSSVLHGARPRRGRGDDNRLRPARPGVGGRRAGGYLAVAGAAAAAAVQAWWRRRDLLRPQRFLGRDRAGRPGVYLMLRRFCLGLVYLEQLEGVPDVVYQRSQVVSDRHRVLGCRVPVGQPDPLALGCCCRLCGVYDGVLEAARAADLVVVPCRAQMLDLETVPNTVQVPELAKVRTAVAVLVAVPPRGQRAGSIKVKVTAEDTTTVETYTVIRVESVTAAARRDGAARLGPEAERARPGGRAARQRRVGA